MNHYEMLRAVSRTFALSIEKLPPVLREAITIAYLLFRIADCIEDHAVISPDRKAYLLRLWGTILNGNGPASQLTAELQDLDAADPEVYVARHADRVMEYLNNQPQQLRKIISKHAHDTAEGMARWQEQGPFINTEEEMDDYMHQVAGRVGYLVTDVFSWYSPVIRKKRKVLIPLGREFGLGLQTVNIIRGLKKDYDRGWVFVPLTFLETKGLSPESFFDAATRQQALGVIDLLIAKAKRHLNNGLTYITLLPRRERHIRLACIWPLLFAVKTLSLSRNNYTVLVSETKMTRKQVKNIVLIASALFWSNSALRSYYHYLER
jgi:farnesyl-diphosphate farnesyltransferase